MLYTPSHAELAQHPKTRKLARMLGISIPTALGHLHLLWHFTLKYAPEGDLSRFDAEEIADGCMWEGDGLAFVRALFAAGWTEYPVEGEGPCVHDWQDHGGKAIKQKESAAERQQRWRDRHKTDTQQAPNEGVTVTSPSHNALDKKRREEKREEENTTGETGADAPQQEAPIPIKRAERETRLPADFPITPRMREWAGKRVPDLDLDKAHEEFCLFWRGDGGRKFDWYATWQHRMVTVNERRQQATPARYGAQAQADMNSGKLRKFVGA